MSIAISDAVTDGIVFAGKCMPTNDTLSRPLLQPTVEFVGAFWGALTVVIIAVVIVAVLFVIASALNGSAKKWMMAIAIVLATPIAVYFIMAIYFVLSGNLPDVPACPF